MGEIMHERSGQVILLGVAICMAAIIVTGVAGRMKEQELAGSQAASPPPDGSQRLSFGHGVVIASFAGIMSACFAYGLAAAKPINDAAHRALVAHGGRELWQSLPALVVVLWGGFTTNALWCGGLLLKNRSAAQFVGAACAGDTEGSGDRLGGLRITINYALAASAGLLWYLQFFFYSMGQTEMGKYDFSSWTLHMAGIILFATLWGAVLHEWRGTSRRTRATGIAGLALLLASTLVVGYGNYLKAH